MQYLFYIILFFLNLKFSFSITCSSGTFYFELTDRCENCSNGCSTCTGFHESQCTTCKTGFNAIQIDNQFYCQKCVKGQYYNTLSSACTACNYDCDMCFSQGTCLICKVGYVYDTTYQKCSTLVCDYGYYQDQVSKKCIICPAPMAQCSSTPVYDVYNVITGTSVTALKCLNNVQLYYGSCTCVYSSYLSGSTCKVCSDANCTSCYSSTTCSLCRDGYYLQGNKCVTICDQTLYYVSWSTPYVYTCYLFSSQVSSYPYKITKISGSYYCNEYLGYENGYGCFNKCRPHEFKLYDTTTNSYLCVTQCPVNYTLDYQYMACVSNSCTNDITYQKGGTCWYRVCAIGTSFQHFISHTQKSVCSTNLSNCINQYDEYTNCIQCQPGYLFDYTTSNCITGCTNSNYYFYGNSCSTCSYSSYTAAQIQTCLTNNRKITYLYNTVTYYGSSTCPEGYSLTGTVCTLCPDPSLITCTSSKTQYVCDQGTNNQVKTCDPLNLALQMPNKKGFDSQGNVVTITASYCKTLNADGTCKVCSSSYNYNFKGVCTQQFARATKYYFYYNNTDTQYQVLDSCSSTQYVSRSGNSGLRLCKDFAYCSNYIKQLVNGTMQNLCTKCPQYFYNLNGNCVENCPNYTFKNITTFNCTTPIDNCAVYSSSTTSPICNTCRQTYMRYLSGTQCIPISTCINGLYYNITSSYCLPCTTGCSSCDSSNKCLIPASGYFLLNSDPVKICPNNYFMNKTSLICQKCSQFCLTCSDTKTCTSSYNGLSYYYLVSSKVYYYVSPICKDNEYFDSALNQCLPCDSSCSQCFQKATYCTTCSNSTYALLNNTCVVPCPDGYYQSTWVTATLNRKVCKPCDAQCYTCTTTSSYCLTCNPGYYFYHNQCLKTCPTNYVAVKQQCMLSCASNQYNPTPDSCGNCLSMCKTCKDATSCTICNSGYVEGNNCVQTCSLNYFLNKSNTVCIQCVNDCEVCDVSIAAAPTCTQCSDGYLLDSTNICQQCDPSCSQCFNGVKSCTLCSDPTQVLYNNTCIASCPLGYYVVQEVTVDYTRQVCKPCDKSCLNSHCQTDSTTCIDGCSSQYYGYYSQCLLVCPIGYQVVNQLCSIICQQGYYNVDRYTCAQCQTGCLTCSDGTTCNDCQNGYYLLNQQCLTSCPLPYFGDSSTSACIKCGSDQCISCSITTSIGTCKQCQSGYILDSNSICTACQLQEYSDPIQNKCLPCDASCNQCTDSSQNCVYCSNPKQTLMNDKCLDVCPSSYFETQDSLNGVQINICKSCDPGCLNQICTNEADYCVLGCEAGLYSYQNKCLKECPSGYNPIDEKCYKICQSNQFNADQDTCTDCMAECKTCQNSFSCASCNSPLVLFIGMCTSSCISPFFLNSKTNECINCGSRNCIECVFDDQNDISGTCVKCKEGYQLNAQIKCEEIEIIDEPKTKEELEESKYVNLPISYTGQIYEGANCHYSCKQCKGKGSDECLSCYLSTRVFFEGKYCLCADGFQEDGNQRCSSQSQNPAKIISYLDLVFDIIILISLALDKIPILTLLLIDVIQIGSYQIYLEDIYNYAGKLPGMKVLYQSNYSKLVLNFFEKMYQVNAGVYQDKLIIDADGDDGRELPLIYNDISIQYILNSIPFFIILGVSILILLLLRIKKHERYSTFLNKYLVILYYLTFQDQIMFIGLQIKQFSFSSPLTKASIISLGIVLLYNIVFLVRAVQLQVESFAIDYKISQQFKLLFSSYSYFFGLIAKLINAISISFVPKQMRIYVYLGAIVYTFILQVFLIKQNFKKQSKLFSAIKILISLQVGVFVLAFLLNYPNSQSQFQGSSLHSIQNLMNHLLIIEKMVLFSGELIILFIKIHQYNYKAGLSTQHQYRSQQDSLSIESQFEMTNGNFELELYPQKQKLNFMKI